ncbi:YdaU family protein [Phaeobacter inhibens]|uniref:YdaU family protein n=1 Tax=Phaeobacter inhibens TaxID=221822 RepID=UPI000C999C0E|nr:YdaU family protein [Phaeobacter inhibens]
MSLPYFPMFPSDFEAKTSHLTLAEDGAYNRLLRICWMTPGCTIPADESWIVRRVRAFTEADREAVRAVLSEFFTVENGRYSNAKLSRIWLEANEAHEKRKNAGSKGGKAKALKTKETGFSNAKAMPKQPEPEPEPYKIEDTNVSLSPADDASFRAVDEIAEAVNDFNVAAGASGWPKVKVLSKARRSALAARLRECGGLDGWRVALEKARGSPHLCGQNDRGWVANFDFLTRQSSFAKLMEGNYDNRDHTGQHQSRPHPGTSRPGHGTAAAFATVAARMSQGAS